MVQNSPVIGIDASTLSEIAGVAVGTLNVWIARGLIPDVTTGTQGRARFFDLDTAIHVAIMTALVRQGYPAPFAADLTYSARQGGWNNRGKLAIERLDPLHFHSWQAPSLSGLDDALDRPEVFTIIEIDRIAERVRTAFRKLDDPNFDADF